MHSETPIVNYFVIIDLKTGLKFETLIDFVLPAVDIIFVRFSPNLA